MKRRTFIKTAGIGALGLAASNWLPAATRILPAAPAWKHWTWIMRDPSVPDDEWQRRFANLRESGINAILPEVYESRHAHFSSRRLPSNDAWLEQIVPLAAAAGLEVHAWMWSMPCNLEEIYTKHPDWYVVNRKGESASTKPAYVPHYRFLCSSHPEVREFVSGNAAELASIDGVTGVHFDYIRLPDVILPDGLQPKYGIVQDREYPEYDYCYCELCRADFKKLSGVDPLTLDDPAANEAWRQFRYDRITRLVNDYMIPAVHERKKMATAAVFPNWENVRQQWSRWNLDAALPMLYHGFYNGNMKWIEDQTRKGVTALQGRLPLYSGILTRQLTPEEIPQAVDAALAGGAQGVVLFAEQLTTEEQWKSFKQAVAAHR